MPRREPRRPAPRLRPREVRPRKRFAQHFLTRTDTARRIVELARIEPTDTVVEIGPGLAALTDLLAARAARLHAIEIDRDLCRRLRERFADDPRVLVEEGDVLDMNVAEMLGSHAPAVVVANLPYNISTPVLVKLLTEPHLFRRLVLMLQRELADRICAAPGSRTYGSLSILVQLVATARVAFRVPPSSFSPRPKVESAVIVIEPFAEQPLEESERAQVRRVVRTAFTRRRKQLSNCLRPLTPEPEDLLRKLDIDPRRRPETLAVEEFVRVARALAHSRHAAEA
jgi:16S rRNA (adenine1518-N6/adenine1519-N6)-dimethyltransferase